VEYAVGPRGGEAVRSLAKFLRVTEARALDLLESGSAGQEIRARYADPVVARRALERRYATRR